MGVLQRKALVCLQFAEQPIASAIRMTFLAAAEDEFSAKAVRAKTQELVERGYIEPLLSGTACGDVTAKGAAALAAAREGGRL